MLFTDFLNSIQNIDSIELPSRTSHLKMAPLERIQQFDEKFEIPISAKKSAVMMLFYPKNSITHILLIIRNSYPGVHSSQIAFPGGKVEDADIDLKATALRETNEEVGIPEENIEVLKQFSSIYIPPSNFLVAPFFGISKSEIHLVLQEEEVAGIIELPLSTLLDDAILKTKIMDTSYAKSINVPVFQIDEHSVWGATAMMMSELKDALKMML